MITYYHGGGNAGSGIINVKYEGLWSTVRDDNFDKENAKVVCAMVGYHTL